MILYTFRATNSPPLIIMIDTKEALWEWKARAQRQPAGKITLDLEADSLHRYHEKLCLIQYADQEGCLIIDPLSIEDLSPFSTWMTSTEIWMHGADYDMTLFRGAFDAMPAMIWDTQIAARLLGFRKFGLAHLVEHFFGIVLSKTSQKADWAKRPLSEKMLEYAENDVRYMLEMSERLVSSLKEKGRYDWFVESCDHAMQKSRLKDQDPAKEHWRIQGSGKLAPRGLAALRSLWNWRDKEARTWDRPPFMVCSNADLLNWSQALQDRKRIDIPVRYSKSRRQHLEQTLTDFHNLDTHEYPEKIRHPRRVRDEYFDKKVDALIAIRDEAAESLDMEPSFIAPRGTLEEIVREEEKGIAQLMSWQREILGFQK